jgi:hypothetical protein
MRRVEGILTSECGRDVELVTGWEEETRDCLAKEAKEAKRP